MKNIPFYPQRKIILQSKIFYFLFFYFFLTIIE